MNGLWNLKSYSMNSARKAFYKISFHLWHILTYPLHGMFIKCIIFQIVSKSVNPWPKIFQPSNLKTVAICPEHYNSNGKIYTRWERMTPTLISKTTWSKLLVHTLQKPKSLLERRMVSIPRKYSGSNTQHSCSVVDTYIKQSSGNPFSNAPPPQITKPKSSYSHTSRTKFYLNS